jgi:hypothetical protein
LLVAAVESGDAGPLLYFRAVHTLARRSRPPSRRALRDAWLTGLLAAIFEPDEAGRRAPESPSAAAPTTSWRRSPSAPPGGTGTPTPPSAS